MASSDALPIPRKNVAFRVTFPILDADGDLVTGATGLDSEISKDGGTFADCTNEATEIATSSGMYYLDLTSTEMNADCVALIIKTSSVGAKTTPIVLYPEEAGDIRVDAVQISGDSTAADNAELMFDGTGYAGGTTKLGVDAVAISGDSTAADNAELMFDGTGYGGGTAKLGVDVVQVSGDATAADNLEAQFDGTGYAGLYLRRNTAQAGAASTMTLDASASATDDLYNGNILAIIGGTGAGQTRYISDYVGSTKVATVSEAWTTTPDNTSVFLVLPNARTVTPRKGAAYTISFLMIDSSDDIAGKTGLTVTVQISKDGAAFASATNTPATEVANGVYKITLTAAEMGADEIILKATGTGANNTFERIVTVP